ncbi:MAG: ABC transporter permease [Spirochaetales bacterium]|nr:ABC transporter permease [Spirochaetales bacterium]
MELVRLAWRNVFRNPRRSVLTILALTVGTVILFLSLGWIGGYHRYVYDTVIDFQTGHGTVLRADYYPERRRLPVDLLIQNYDEVRQTVAEVEGVAAATGRVQFPVRVGTGSQSFMMGAKAVDLRHEHDVGALARYVVAGQGPTGRGSAEQRGIWIGRSVAEKAEIAVGDVLFLRALNRHGVENLYDAPVVGLFDYGYPTLDDRVVYLALGTAEELLDLDGGVTEIVYRLEPGVSVTDARARVASALVSDAIERGLEARTWRDFARAAVSAVESDTNGFAIMTALMYLLIVLGILNTMSMSVHERTREIGTIRAVGAGRRFLRCMFAAESVAQAMIALVAAAMISTPIALYLGRTGVDIASSMPAELPVPFGERFRASFAPWHFGVAIVSAPATALIGSMIPIRRAGRITVAEAMRETT